MILKKKRIRSLTFLKSLINRGDKFTVGLTDPERFLGIIGNLGFSDTVEPGEAVLPSSEYGPISHFNAEGKYLVNRDKPMETAYRQAEWHWTEWHGQYDRVEQSKIVDVPYKRYPRTFIVPPSVELAIYKNTAGKTILAGPTLEFTATQDQIIIHVINLFLEIFGECEFFTENLDSIIKVPLRHLNWTILPPGQRPWQSLKKEVQPIIDGVPDGNKPVIEYRLETINKHKPDFAAVGRGGFRGYVVLGFEKEQLFVFESLFYGNATYVFNKDWEDLSKRTKADILSEGLQLDRIIHRKGWDTRMNNLLRNTRPKSDA
jgi:hypothetical protein